MPQKTCRHTKNFQNKNRLRVFTWMLVKEVLLNKVDNFPSEGIVKSPELFPLSKDSFLPPSCEGEALDRAKFIFWVVNTDGAASGVM